MLALCGTSLNSCMLERPGTINRVINTIN
ncbi:unnamed protein product [Cuscuta epithymum]|uniref:Uncharacterized protein n=1 Tax=Cuscuta epithymum TaxID=186058 RepID=A0AAV0G8K7_9ASTE|nr:unnamed protein product [Cuscuta epithymum]